MYGTIYALEENLDVLSNCLFETNLIDWKRIVKMTAIPLRCVAVVKSVLSANGLTDLVNYSDISELNYMPIDEIKNCLMPR